MDSREKVDTDEALRSALSRLPMAVLIVDHLKQLRPMNSRGQLFFQAEGLRQDLLEMRPSHPLSKVIGEILEVEPADVFDERTIRFPSGQRYSVEPSRPSQKGRGRWLMLLITPSSTSMNADGTMVEGSAFTPCERTTATLLTRGLSNKEIAGELGVSMETVKSHVAGVLEKTDSRSRGEFLSKLLRLR